MTSFFLFIAALLIHASPCSCVRQSTCERPFCANGVYSVDTGYCPCPEDTPDCRNSHQDQVQVQGQEDEADETAATTSNEQLTTGNEQLTTEEATNSSSYEQQ